MITIGYSTRNSNPELQEYFKKTCGLKNVQVIEKVNNGEKSLNETYNEILEQSENNIVIFCHDDIYFETKSWGFKILDHFRKTNYGILGVAGSTYIPKSGKWWEDRRKMVGIVNHEHDGKKWESKYSDSQGNTIKETILVDGLFIAVQKDRIKYKFNEDVKGFHFYDLEFCISNHISEVKIGVLTNIRITHKSVGMTNEEWEKNRQLFSERHREILPIKLPKQKDEKLKILISTSNLDGDETEKLTEIIKKITIKNEVYLITDINQNKISDLIRKTNLKIYTQNEPPGFKLGDGIWQLNTPQGVVTSAKDMLYKIKEIFFDIILIHDTKNVSKFSHLYPNTEIVTLSKETKNIYDNVVKKEIKFSEIDNFDINNILYDVVNSIEEPIVKQKIKIISGHSERGGSTTAFINLTNQLNMNGYDCTFYGPHEWHLDKCKSSKIEYVSVDENDILIFHFIPLNERPKAKKVILALHEKNLFEISNMKPVWDEVIFLNEKHREYHSGYKGPYSIIPNLKETLEKKEKSHLKKVAGIIGTIDENKQTHISIDRAVSDGCEKIYLFGNITDINYYENFVKPKISDNIILMGHVENKQQMYDMIGKVYISSKSEVACLVKDECYSTGTEFCGNDVTSHEPNVLTNNEIIENWINIFEK